MSTGNNHTLHYPRPPFAEQPQRAPGLASEMKPYRIMVKQVISGQENWQEKKR